MFPSSHLLQTPEWGAFKQVFGWDPRVVSTSSATAQILFKQLPLGLTVAYLPKGPVGSNWAELWQEADQLCKQKHAVFLQVEPDYFEPQPDWIKPQWMDGFTLEPHTFQPRRTILIDLTQEEDALLAAMKQKTRYNIRLAKKKGVVVEESADLEEFYQLTRTTGERDGFAIHSRDYYETVYKLFAPLGQCVLLRASVEGNPLAYLMLFLKDDRSWYFYGASDDASRNLMPTYLLQWEAMRIAKARGAASYDLWGIPDEDEEILEQDFTSRSDGLWGVYRFKRGFGGEVKRSAPAFVRIYKPLLYKAYQIYRAKRGGEDAGG